MDLCWRRKTSLSRASSTGQRVLQPITMLNGQAAGTIAALAVKEGVQPRQVNPIAVQVAQLASGSNLIQRW